MKPLLKWAGNKARLAHQIDEAFAQPCSGTYYEPFVGSGAVFFHRRLAGNVQKAVLSDFNHKLIELFRCVRDDVHGVLEALERLPYETWRESYYDIRTAFNELDPVGPDHAARFIFLNRAGFNGLYRENRKGEFNVPVGRYKSLKVPTRETFMQASELLQSVELVAGSFEDVMSQAGRGDQVYCDPPYVPLTATAAFTAYCSSPFGFEKQKVLANLAMQAAFRGGQVVLSNHDLPVVRNELYPLDNGFSHVARPMVARAISRKAASRKPVKEVIASIGPLGSLR